MTMTTMVMMQSDHQSRHVHGMLWAGERHKSAVLWLSVLGIGNQQEPIRNYIGCMR